MIRLAWRQMRLPAISTATLLAALVLLLVLTEHSMTVYQHTSGITSCLATHGDCADAIAAFIDRYGMWTSVISVLGFAPVLVGLFWGAPLIAREVEQGTHRLAWSQSISRRRWFVVRAGLYLAGAAAVGALLAWLFTWWYGPLVRVDHDGFSAIQPAIFESRGVVLVATMFYAFAVGIAAGAVIRRTVPAMAAALVGYLAERIVFELERGHLLPPRTLTIPLGGGYPRDGLGDWVLSQQTIDSSGHAVSFQTISAACAKGDGPAAMFACANAHGFRLVFTYQPLSRFWPLQGIESGILLAATVLLVAVAAWWTLRRLS